MDARRIGHTTIMHIRTFSREKASLFFTFFFPIMLMVLFGLIFQNQGNVSYNIVVQDKDNTPLSHNFTSVLGKVQGITVERIDANLSPDDYIKDSSKNANFILVIPRGFQAAVIARASYDPNATSNFTVKYDPSQSSAQVKLSLLASVVQQMNLNISGTRNTIGFRPESVLSTQFTYIEFFIPGLIGLTVMTSSVFGSTRASAPRSPRSFAAWRSSAMQSATRLSASSASKSIAGSSRWPAGNRFTGTEARRGRSASRRPIARRAGASAGGNRELESAGR